jgi:hypothetical protein
MAALTFLPLLVLLDIVDFITELQILMTPLHAYLGRWVSKNLASFSINT